MDFENYVFKGRVKVDKYFTDENEFEEFVSNCENFFGSDFKWQKSYTNCED